MLSEEEGWLSLARQGLVAGATRVVGANGKVGLERWYLSPYVEKPLNLEVIKTFVPELRSCKCFSCFGIPMFYIYMSYEHYMYVSHIHVWVCYSTPSLPLLSGPLWPRVVAGCPCGVMVKAMDCGIVVSEFVLQSHYYVHFWANTLGKGMNPLILPAMG